METCLRSIKPVSFSSILNTIITSSFHQLSINSLALSELDFNFVPSSYSNQSNARTHTLQSGQNLDSFHASFTSSTHSTPRDSTNSEESCVKDKLTHKSMIFKQDIYYTTIAVNKNESSLLPVRRFNQVTKAHVWNDSDSGSDRGSALDEPENNEEYDHGILDAYTTNLGIHHDNDCDDASKKGLVDTKSMDVHSKSLNNGLEKKRVHPNRQDSKTRLNEERIKETRVKE